MEKGTAFISGATAGIGQATARRLAKADYALILTGRREDRLKTLAAELREETEVQTAVLDVRDSSAIHELFKAYPQWLIETTVLVNNAGLAAGTQKMQDANLDDWDQMFDTNVKGLLHLTQKFLPSMVARRTGHIVNLGSVAGRQVYPGGGVYCATKFAVRALTEGLRMDLLGTGVRVTNISPGMVETEFSEVRMKSATKAKAVYQGMQPLSADDIAEAIYWSIERPAHVNIQELVIYPTDQAGIGLVHRTT
jgi:3-hydroxy acid dehydrogenase/malonic semialdehyde reductase